MSASYIQRIEINGFWGQHQIVWENLNPDVNILVGINGSGKTTLLKAINAVFFLDRKKLQGLGINQTIIVGNDFRFEINSSLTSYNSDSDFEHQVISTFDVPISNKSKLKQEESPLTLELRNLILQTGSNSFNDYRLKATFSPEKAFEVNERIKKLFKQINDLFKSTGKSIYIDPTNKIAFTNIDSTIQLEQLSAGEKQLLLILMKVFLMENKPAILLMDEPEISLHISWQQDLIKILRELNPNCQLIIATHSPSIFGKGWGDKITFMENLFQK